MQTSLEHHSNRPGGGVISETSWRSWRTSGRRLGSVVAQRQAETISGIKGFGDARGRRIWGLVLPIFEYWMEKVILKWFVCFGFGSKSRLVCIARSFLLGPLLGSGTVAKLDIGPYPTLPPTVRTNDINVFTTAQTKVLTQKPRKFGFWFCVL